MYSVVTRKQSLVREYQQLFTNTYFSQLPDTKTPSTVTEDSIGGFKGMASFNHQDDYQRAFPIALTIPYCLLQFLYSQVTVLSQENHIPFFSTSRNIKRLSS